ncbi:hypothetical protein BX616_009217, partial [Lobosporangium transversale]
MARKRRYYTDLGLDSEAAETILDNPQTQRRHKKYAPAQQVFIDWARQNDRDPFTPNPILLVNYLNHQMRNRPWSPATTLQKRSAILALFPDKSAFDKSHVYKDFITAIKAKHIRPSNALSINLNPALDYIRSLPSNEEMSFLQLTRKLCWLLGVCG